MGKGSGYGKSILFGEHFVLYEYQGEALPAIAAAIGSSTMCYVRPISSPGWRLTDRRPAVPGYKSKKKEEQRVSIDNILRFADIDVSEQGIHITLEGRLVCASGVGASAASCCALARALNDEFDLGWDDHQVNAAAFEGEKGYHGTPSGLDNTVATFGGIVWFQRGASGDPPTVETIKLKEPTEMVIASSGITASTKDVVDDVRRMKEEKVNWFEQILEDYKDIVEAGRQGLVEMDLRLIGLLMNQNHNLLIEIGVTCDEIEEIVGVARKAGAWGAKVTGTGRGGNVIALTPGRDLQSNVAGAIEQRGFSVWTIRIGV